MNSREKEIDSPSQIIDDINDQNSDTCMYYELSDLENGVNDGFRYCALHINIHSVLAKLDDLKHIIYILKEKHIIIDFILLCETFLNENNVALCKIDGYNLVCKNRTKGSRGGVAIYVLEGLSYKIRNDLAVHIDNEFESIFIEVKHRRDSVIVGEIYRVPNSNIKLSIERYHNIVNKLKGINCDVIIGTDQNFDLIKYNRDTNIKDLLNGIISAGFLPAITKPTRITHKSATLIDNIYLKGFSYYTYLANIIDYDISDHLPIIAYLGKTSSRPKPEPICFERRTWTEVATASITQDMVSRDWSCLDTEPLNDAFNLFSETLQKTVEEKVPIKYVTVPPKHIKREPWMSKGLLVSARTKQKLFRKSKDKAKDHPFVKRYFVYKSLYNKLKRKAKFFYTNKILTSYKNNAKKTWEFINNSMGKTKNKRSCIDLLKTSKGHINDQKEIAEEFCKFFTNVGKKQSNQIGQTATSVAQYLKDKNFNKTLYLQPTDVIEIRQLVLNLKSSTSCGYDNLSSKVLKQIIPGIAHPLVTLINRSLSEGIFPDALKTAKVIPVYKNGESDDINNYRPISLLTTLSKIFEKVIFKRIYNFIDSNNLLDPRQFGFRPQHSTVDAIATLTNDILHAFNKKDYTISIFCDLSKAFDTIDHETLLFKLQRYGIRGNALNLIGSYLKQRKQFISNGKQCSATVDVPPYGVPQGSILGPLLFICYINDLSASLQYCKHILYADDTTLYLAGPNLKVLSKQVNHDLEGLSNWFKANKLTLNIKKTNYMIFTNKKDKLLNITIEIGGTEIKQVSCTKFLGIYLDNLLKWDAHINYIVKKISSGLYALNSMKRYLTKHNLTSLYYALIHPHLMYGCLLWGNTFKKHLHKIEVMQKKAIRIICHANYNASSDPLFKDKHILKLNDIYKLLTMQFMYKIQAECVPKPLKGLFTQNLDYHDCNTRHKKDFVILRFNNQIVQNSFIVNGPKLWNSLSQNLKGLRYKMFSTQLKASLINHY